MRELALEIVLAGASIGFLITSALGSWIDPSKITLAATAALQAIAAALIALVVRNLRRAITPRPPGESKSR